MGRLRPALLTDLRIHARLEVSTPKAAPLLAELIAAGQIQMLSLMDHTPGQGQYRNIEHYIGFIAKWRQVDPSHVEEEVRERLARSGDLMERWVIARDIAALAHAMGLPIASHDDDTLEKVDLVARTRATSAPARPSTPVWSTPWPPTITRPRWCRRSSAWPPPGHLAWPPLNLV